MSDGQSVPCKYCGKPTPMLGTKLCDSCWELASRIGRAKRDVLDNIIIGERDDVELRRIDRIKALATGGEK